MMFVVFPIFGMTSLTAISENTRWSQNISGISAFIIHSSCQHYSNKRTWLPFDLNQHQPTLLSDIHDTWPASQAASPANRRIDQIQEEDQRLKNVLNLGICIPANIQHNLVIPCVHTFYLLIQDPKKASTLQYQQWTAARALPICLSWFSGR